MLMWTVEVGQFAQRFLSAKVRGFGFPFSRPNADSVVVLHASHG